MRITITMAKVREFVFTRRHRRDVFDYDVTSFDDARKYCVYYGGTQPLSPGRNGTMLGDVANLHGSDEWWATYDDGDAVGLRWYPPTAGG